MLLFLWHRMSELTRRGVQFSFAAGRASLPPGTSGFRVTRDATDLATAEGSTILLGDVPAKHLGRVEVRWPEGALVSAQAIPLDDAEPPEPTVAAVLDLVIEEARSFAQQQGEPYEPG